MHDETENKKASVNVPFTDAADKFLGNLITTAPPEALYHYTSAQGLIDILSSNCIWMTNAAYLNDPTEVDYGLDILLEACRSIVIGLSAQEEKFIHDVFKETVGQKLFFKMAVFCTSETDDLLNQWRDYGKDDVAYCIGFDWRKMVEFEEGIPDSNFQADIARMIYDADYQSERCKKLLQIFLEWGVAPSIEQSTLSTKELIIIASVYVLTMLRMFKHPAFSAEQEIRLMVEVKSIPSDIKPSYRSTPLGVTPYFKWGWNDNSRPLPITSVRVGPCRHPKAAKQALEDLLIDYGYTNVTVTGSTAPTR